MIKKLPISVKEKFQFKKTTFVFEILKPVVLFFAIFFSVSSFSQPGDSRFTHTFTITAPNGDTMIFEGLTGNRVDFPSRIFDEFHEPIKKNKIINNQIVITYTSTYLARSVKFIVHSKGEKMEIETNSRDLKIPFIPGSFYIPLEYGELFNSGLNITNRDLNYFRTDADSIRIPELPTKVVHNEDKRAYNVLRINDSTIVGLTKKYSISENFGFLKSFNNGLTWESDSIIVHDFKIGYYEQAELVIENENSFFIIISRNTKQGFVSVIIESKNGGITWKNNTVLASLKITNLFFLDDGTGIAASIQTDRINFYVKEKGMKEWNFSGSENSIVQPFEIIANENGIFVIEHKQVWENSQNYHRDTITASFDYAATWVKHLIMDTCSFESGGKFLTNNFGRNPYLFLDQQNPNYCRHNEQVNGFYAYEYKEGRNTLTINIALFNNCLFLSRDQGKTWKYIPLFAEGTKLSNKTNNYDLIFLNSEEILLIGFRSMSIGNIKGF